MFKKLKEKSKASFFYLVLATLLFSVVGGFLVFPRISAAATTFDVSGISVTTSVQTYNPDGSLNANGNFVRVGNDSSGSFKVHVTVTLAQVNPTGVVNIGGSNPDLINIPKTTISNQPIQGFGITGFAKVVEGQSNPGAGVPCFADTLTTLWIQTAVFYKCDGPIKDTNTTAKQAKVGDVLYDNTITVTQSQFKGLGLSNIASSTNASVYNEFYIVPNIWYNSSLFFTLMGAGKSVYVQLYSSSTEAAAHINDAVPSGVPANGSNTGTGPNAGSGGSPLLGFINQLLGAILGLVNEFLFLVFYALVAPLIQALLSIHTYTDTFVGVIYPAWILIRNFCDILFIVAIIAIAMATLFRVESYQYKHLLVQLMIAALLVNFSLVIGQAVLGIADTMQNTFLPNNTEVIRSLAKGMMVDYRTQVYTTNFQSQGYFADTIKPLFFLSLALGTFAVFVAIAAFLVVRIVALWILLMVSPVAYVSGILPITEEYRKMWWKEFIHYAFFTPIMALLLNIAGSIYILQTSNPVLKQIMTQPVSDLGSANIGPFVVSVSSNLILLVFLFVALNVANKLGIVGGDIASKWGKEALGAPFKGAGFLAKRGGGLVARKYNEATASLVTQEHGKVGIAKKALFAVSNPVNFFRGWEERSHERKEQAHELAKGAGLVVASELLTLGREKIDYKQLAMQKIQRQYASKLKESMGDDVGRAAAMDIQRRVLHVKGFEGEMLRGAVALLTGDYGWGDDTNEIPSSPEEKKKIRADLVKRGTNKEGLQLFDVACETYNDQGFEAMQWAMQGLDLNMLAKLRNKVTNKDNQMYRRDNHGQFVDKDMAKFVSDEKHQRALMNMAALTDGAKKVGHYEQMFLSKKDEKTGFFIPLVDVEGLVDENGNEDASKGMRSGEIMGEVKKIDIRNFLRQTAPHNFLNKVKKYVKKKDPVTGDEYTEEEWERGSVGKGGKNLTMLQRAIWKQVGSKYVARSAESQARIITDLAGKYVNNDGSIKPETAQDFLDIIELNPEFVDGLRNVEISGAPYIGGVGKLDTKELINEANLTIIVKNKPGTPEAERAAAELKVIVADRVKKITELNARKKSEGAAGSPEE